jgi:hypothetical protein
MRQLLLLAALLPALLLQALTWTDSDLGFLNETAIRQAAADATLQKYPDADTILLDEEARLEYQPDGSYVQICDTAKKIMTLAGVESSRELQSYYDAKYSRAKISLVQILRGSETIPLDLAACTQEMTENSQMGSNIYDPDHRVIKVTVAGLKPGDVLRAVYVDEIQKPRVPDSFSQSFLLEQDQPILHTHIQIQAPAALPLKSMIVKDTQGKAPVFQKTEHSGGILYSWETAEPVPQYFPEPGMPSGVAGRQRVLMSTFESWAQVSQWYNNLCQPRLVPDQNIRDGVEALLRGIDDPKEKVLALYNFVSQKVRYMGLTLEDSAPGYEPHDVTFTYAQRAGVCRDMAALLVSMLQVAGFESHPALIHVGYPKDEEVPQPFFNHAITAVKLPGDEKWTLLDPTASNAKDPFPAYLSDTSYLVATPEGDPLRRAAVTPCDRNQTAIQTVAKLSPEGDLSVRAKILFQGLADQAYRNFFLDCPPEQRRLFFQTQISKVLPGATLESLEILPEDLMDLSHILEARFSCKAPQALIAGRSAKDGSPDLPPGATAMLALPRFSKVIGLNLLPFSQATLDKRRFPLETSCAASVAEELLVDLPDGVEIRSAPKYTDLDDESFCLKRTLDTLPGRLHYQGFYANKAVRFSPEQYGRMKRALAIRDAEDRKMAILRFQETAPEAAAKDSAEQQEQADLDILERKTVVQVLSPSSWTVETSTKYKVLTYAGIQSADISIPFNPAWEEVEILLARVTTDGKTQDAPKENQNLMDASWAASAPRYPAGKILVLSLPGVEVGSEVEVQIRRTLKNRPFFRYAETLRDDDPIRLWSLDILAPKELAVKPKYLPNGWLDLPQDTKDPVKVDQRKYSLPGDMIRYSLVAQNLPAIHQESSRPPEYAYLPTVVVDAGDWGDYAKSLSRMVDALGDGGEVIQAMVAPLLGLSPEDRLVEIRLWMEKNIRQSGPAHYALPLSCLSTPKITARDGYGNSADRAILYRALLKAAGFEPRLYLASDTPQYKELQLFYREFPNAALFSQWLVSVTLNKEEIWFNDQSQYSQFGTSRYDHGILLALNGGSLRTMNLPQDYQDRSRCHWILKVADDGSADLTVEETIQGSRFGTLKRYYQWLTPEERRRHYVQLVSDIAQDATPVTPDLTTDFQHYPGTISYTVKLAKCAVLEDGFCYLRLPVNLASPLAAARDPREFHPLYRSRFQQSTIVLDVELPAQFRTVVLKPARFAWKAPDGTGSILWQSEGREPAANSPRKITFTYECQLAPGVTPLRLYPQYQEAYRRLLHPDATTLLLAK